MDERDGDDPTDLPGRSSSDDFQSLVIHIFGYQMDIEPEKQTGHRLKGWEVDHSSIIYVRQFTFICFINPLNP